VPPASPEARAADRAKEELARQAGSPGATGGRVPAQRSEAGLSASAPPAPTSPLPEGEGVGVRVPPDEVPSDEAPPQPAAPAPAVHVPGQTALDFGTPDLENGSDREAALTRIAAEVAECTRCPELVANRTLTVPGQGSPYARLVFVGEGPGQEEDRQGLAFVGRAGELLTKMIEAIGMTRQEVFIANIIKCRAPGNRQPLPDEAANCAGYLARQLEILRPKVIVALGGTAAQHLLQTHDGITRLRGRFYTYGAAQLMPTFHPAYVLRNYTPDTRKKVYDDLLKVKAALVA
jgi:DNA polymerase